MIDLDQRKSRADLLRGREVRRLTSSQMECRTADGMHTFRGMASSTDSPYDMGFYTETITRGAFDKTLSERPDVQLLVNHEGLPLARTTNGSLTLRDEGDGLRFEARASADDPDATRVASKVESGLMDQCSFAFRVTRQEWDEDYTERSIKEVSLDRGDVSIVNYGANPNTNVSMRALFAELADVSDEDLAEWRDDPAVITIVRRLAIPDLTPPPPADFTGPGIDLSLAQARATALRLRAAL